MFTEIPNMMSGNIKKVCSVVCFSKVYNEHFARLSKLGFRPEREYHYADSLLINIESKTKDENTTTSVFSNEEQYDAYCKSKLDATHKKMVELNKRLKDVQDEINSIWSYLNSINKQIADHTDAKKQFEKFVHFSNKAAADFVAKK
jgi:hypothetical protein